MKTFLRLFLWVSVSLGATSAAESIPNILFVLADDMGYGDLGANNPKSKIPTPNLDQLAASGMRFTDAHAGGSVCVPSRYALLTGRFSARAAMDVGRAPVIEEGRMTIASLLKLRGYTTAMVGKWHQGFDMLPGGDRNEFDYSKPLTGGPADRGFQSYFGMHASLDIPPYFFIRDRDPLMPPTETVEAKSSVGGPEGWNQIQGAFWREGLVAPDFKHDEVTPRFATEAMRVIQSYGAGEKEKPLFLYVALPSPHTPWLPLERFRGKSGAGMYGDFVMQVDDVVGQVLASLDAAGIAKDTLVFFSSDNGPVWYDKDREKFGHDAVGGLRGMKGQAYEGGHRMPFLARWPGKVTPGSVCEQTIAFSDVFATFAELVDTQIPAGNGEDSVSFLPYLLDSTKAPTPRAPIVHSDKVLRDGDWKLILPRRQRELGGGKGSKQVPTELYNLRDDLAETTNLFSQESDRAEKMEEMLEAILAH